MNKKTNPSKINSENVVLIDDIQTVVKLVNHPLPDSLLKRIEALRTSEKKDKLVPK